MLGRDDDTLTTPRLTNCILALTPQQVQSICSLLAWICISPANVITQRYWNWRLFLLISINRKWSWWERGTGWDPPPWEGDEITTLQSPQWLEWVWLQIGTNCECKPCPELGYFLEFCPKYIMYLRLNLVTLLCKRCYQQS